VEEIVTGEAVILDLPVARFPTRMLARVIDMAVQVAVFFVIAIITGVAGASGSLDSAVAAAILITAIVVTLVGYPVAMETLSRGRTLGKLALGLRVVSDDGGPVRFRQALVRALAGVIECWGLVGIPALITSMLSARGKRLGDIFAGTFVVRVRAPRPVMGGYQARAYGAGGYRAGGYGAGVGVTGMPVEPALQPWAARLDLSALPEPLAASAASYLTRYWQLDARVRDQLGWQLASDIAARVSPPPPPGLPPVAYLNAVLAQRREREMARLWAASPPPVASPPGPSGPVVTAPSAAFPPPAVSPPAAGEPWPAPASPSPDSGGFAPPA
jgi:uncharacterized RDD family membrane protein YckC